MRRIRLDRLLTALCLSGALLGMLSFFSVSRAEPMPLPLPFTMADDQRSEMIKELRDIKELLKEQNSLLRQMAKPEKHEPARRP